MRKLRVALLPCAYTEVDGVANTIRHFEAFAQRHQLPLLNIHGGFSSHREEDGWVERLEFPRRWPKFRLDARHDFDLNFWRYLGRIEDAVRAFRADLVHITGPSDVGQIGALVAHRLRIPLIASWHTNVHQYAEQRLLPFLSFLSGQNKEWLGTRVDQICMRLAARFYRIARVLFAPNQELIAQLERLTAKPCYLMSRGVDTELFHPARRTRSDQQFVIGYVGRLTTEKNIRFLRELEQGLLVRGCDQFRLVIVGQGADAGWLQQHLRQADLTGVLEGEHLAEAYANFDLFVFPSRTDTFGNVVLEALAAGVPSVVTDCGGPKYIVRDGVTGYVASSEQDFIDKVAMLCRNRDLCLPMSRAARQHAMGYSWDEVFRHVYDVYENTLCRLHLTPNFTQLSRGVIAGSCGGQRSKVGI
jgi:glycosyltransferase involved in cell wall biosynthesis